MKKEGKGAESERRETTSWSKALTKLANKQDHAKRPIITRNGKDPVEENTTISIKNAQKKRERTQKGKAQRQKSKRKNPLRCNKKDRTLPIQGLKGISISRRKGDGTKKMTEKVSV